MTRNRKADLQRKLGMAKVATPPDGLADRIKSDIPRQLRFDPEHERTHLRQSVAFNLRIAASIVLLASSLYFALHLFSRSKTSAIPSAASDERMSAPVPQQAIVALPNTPPQPGRMRVQQTADLPVLPNSPPGGSASAQPKNQMAEKKREESDGMSTGASSYAGTIEAAPIAAEPVTVANAVPEPAPEAARETGSVMAERENRDLPAAKTAAAQTASASRSAGGFATSLAAPALIPPPPVAAPLSERDDTRAKESAALKKDSANLKNVDAIERSIARGETPRNGDLDAIVQHFSAPDSAPARLRVEIEASATPLDPARWLLRVSVDAPGSARMEIGLSFGDAIAAHRVLTGTLAPNETALYEIEFKGGAAPDQLIASVRAGGVERDVRVRDLHQWNSASPRMKRVSLAAAWARTLQSRTRVDAIVARAREAHIDDLADLAERVERNR